MIFKEIYEYREMIASLVRRDLKGRYRGSVLGFLWTFLNPLLQLMVYTLVFSKILNAGHENYHLFLFVALIPWMFFSSCLSGGASAVLGEKGLVTKIYFPREVLPISFTLSNFINMLYSLVVVRLVVALTNYNLRLELWVYLPVIMFSQLLLCLGVTFITSSVTVFFRDMQHILGIVAMAWQFLTPIVYTIDAVPDDLKPVFMLNPMTSIVVAYRDVLYYGQAPQLQTLGTSLLFGLLVLVLGFGVFSILKRNFAEEL